MDTVALPVHAEASALRGLRVLIVEDSYVIAREKSFNLIDRLHEAGIPVLAMSGLAAQTTAAAASAVLQKPFSGPELLAALQGICASSLPSATS